MAAMIRYFDPAKDGASEIRSLTERIIPVTVL